MTNVLNLPNWKVLNVEEHEHDYQVTAQYQPSPIGCEGCRVVHPRLVKFGTKHQIFVDAPLHAKWVKIVVIRQRYLCRECGRTFLERLPDIDVEHFMTRRALQYIQTESLKRAFLSVARDVGVNESTVRIIFKEHVAELDKMPVAPPVWMGLGTLSLIDKPRCVIANVEQNTIVDLLKDCNKATLAKRLSQRIDRSAIRHVCMEMWHPYKEAVQAVLPGAVIVIDRFHVVPLADAALNAVRRDVRSSLPTSRLTQLKGDRFILPLRKRDLAPDQALLLEQWASAFPVLGAAYTLKEAFCSIWDRAESRQQAKELYAEWERQITPELRSFFQPLTTAVSNWSAEIFAYFDLQPRLVHTYTESLNNIIHRIDRIGRGYSFRAIRAKVLYGSDLRKVVLPNSKSKLRREKRLAGMALSHPHAREDGRLDYGVDMALLEQFLRETEL